MSTANELKSLIELARPLGLFVGQHKQSRDPLACYFVARRNSYEPHMLKYATAQKVRAYLANPSKTDDDVSEELSALRNAARPHGFWVGEHHDFDPCRGGPYYVMRKKTQPDQKNPTLLRYATREMIEDFLTQAAETYAA